MISSSPWEKIPGFVPATGMKPGSLVPLLMSNAWYRSVLAAPAGLACDATATPMVPLAASAAPAAMIAVLRTDLYMLTSWCLMFRGWRRSCERRLGTVRSALAAGGVLGRGRHLVAGDDVDLDTVWTWQQRPVLAGQQIGGHDRALGGV